MYCPLPEPWEPSRPRHPETNHEDDEDAEVKY